MPDDPMKQILIRAIFALKTPSPDGSPHYQSGWDDGLEAAIDEVSRVFDQVAAVRTGTPMSTEEISARIALKRAEPAFRNLAAALEPRPRTTAIRKKLRGWAYSAGHIESELDAAVDRMYQLIAQDVIAGMGSNAPQPVKEP